MLIYNNTFSPNFQEILLKCHDWEKSKEYSDNSSKTMIQKELRHHDRQLSHLWITIQDPPFETVTNVLSKYLLTVPRLSSESVLRHPASSMSNQAPDIYFVDILLLYFSDEREKTLGDKQIL